MRAVVSTLMLLCATVGAGAQALPRFDVEAICRSAPALRGGIQNPDADCIRDETAARASLERRWATFSAEQRATDLGETGIEGTPSDVEVLTCLELSGDGAPPRPARRGAPSR